MSISKAIARGELGADALADELEVVPDVLDEMLAEGLMHDDIEVPGGVAMLLPLSLFSPPTVSFFIFDKNVDDIQTGYLPQSGMGMPGHALSARQRACEVPASTACASIHNAA